MQQYSIYITIFFAFVFLSNSNALERSPESIEGPQSFVEENINSSRGQLRSSLFLNSHFTNKFFPQINFPKRTVASDPIKFGFHSFPDKLCEQFNLHLGSLNSFLLLRGGTIDVNSNLSQPADIKNNYVAYQTFLGIGFKARVFRDVTVQPNFSFLEYHISRYRNPQNIVPDIEMFKIRHGFFPQFRLSLGIFFGKK